MERFFFSLTLFSFSTTRSKSSIFPEVDRYRTAVVQKSVPSFQVVYKKHTLTLDDLCTLADQNWLNDQVEEPSSRPRRSACVCV